MPKELMGNAASFLGVFLLALGLAALVAAELAKRLLRLDADYSGPRRTAGAVVSARWREEYDQGSKKGCKTRIRTYHAAFALEDGSRVELWMPWRKYRRLSEGGSGRLTWQGGRLIKFEPAGERHESRSHLYPRRGQTYGRPPERPGH